MKVGWRGRSRGRHCFLRYQQNQQQRRRQRKRAEREEEKRKEKKGRIENSQRGKSKRKQMAEIVRLSTLCMMDAPLPCSASMPLAWTQVSNYARVYNPIHVHLIYCLFINTRRIFYIFRHPRLQQRTYHHSCLFPTGTGAMV